MKKKIMSVILVFMLVISVSLLNVSIIKAEVSSDTEGPIIETVSINTHNVTSGDSVTVTATVSDESAIDHIYAYFYLSGTNNWHAANLELQDDGTYQGTLAITDAWINGTYNIDLVIAEDVKGNSTSLKSSSDDNGILEETYLNVTGCSSDAVGPVIDAVNIDQHDVTAGDTVTVTVIVSDESAMDHVYAYFYLSGTSNWHAANLKLQDDGTYQGTLAITDTWINGTYNIDLVTAEDVNGNSTSLKSSSDDNGILKDTYLYVTGCSTDNEGPVIDKVNVDQTDVTIGDTIIVTAIISDESALDHVYAYFYLNETSNWKAANLTLQDDGTYQGTLKITDAFSAGVYNCSQIIAEDVSGNSTSYKNSSYTDSILGDAYFYVCNSEHSYNDGEIISVASCISEGSILYTCETCGKTITETINLDETNHESVVIDASKEAMCTETGLTEGSHCSACGEVLVEQEEIPATGHTVVIDASKEATCTETGLTEGSHCSVCGEVLVAQETIPATGHSYDNGVVTTEATCTEDGEITYTCENCEDTYTETIEASGHTVVTDEAVDATCTEAGLTEGSYCSVCGEVIVEQEVIPALGHDYDNGVVTTEATCTEDGVITYTCSRCGDTYTEAIVATGHTAGDTVIVTKEATCAEPGEMSYVCTVCGETIEAEEISALGHAYDEGEVIKETTCTEDGYITYTCSRCGDSYTEVIEALGHEYESEVTDATCTEDGYIAYTCNRCGDSYTEVINALGHEYETEVTEPTCTEAGYTTYTCIRCGDRYIANEVEALGHSWDEGVVAENTIIYTCIVCGETKTESTNASGGNNDDTNQNTEDNSGDTGSEDSSGDAGSEDTRDWDTVCVGNSTSITISSSSDQTYTFSCADGAAVSAVLTGQSSSVISVGGVSRGTYSKTYRVTVTAIGKHVLNIVGSSGSSNEYYLEVLDHDYTETEVTEATCTEGGYITYTCSRCGSSYTEVIEEALGHSYETEVTEATCTEDGYITYTCSRCGSSYTEVIEEALGHEYESEVRDATCTEDGYITYTCNRCGSSYTEVIEAMGHSYETEMREATCIEDGYITYTCSRCGYSHTEVTEALGHSYETEVTEPTCTEAGYTTYTCIRCGDRYTANEVAALGHSWDEGVVAGNTITYTCIVCGETKTENANASGENTDDTNQNTEDNSGDAGSKDTSDADDTEDSSSSADTLLVRRGNWFYVNYTMKGGNADMSFTYGKDADEVLIGDWDGDGIDTICVRRGNRFYFSNTLGGQADFYIDFGRTSDEVVVGDWDGDGCDTICVRRGNHYYINNTLESGNAEIDFTFGRVDDEVLSGDWDGDGYDTLCIRRGNHYYINNTLEGGNAAIDFTFGRTSDSVLAGDWDGDGYDTLCIRRGNHYYINNTLEGGNAAIDFTFGREGDEVYAGTWQ